MAEIRVPALGESVTEATIGKWFKKPGDPVAVDEPLVELETDKVTIEVPAPAAGVLGEIAARDGETVAVGALLGQITDGAAAAKPAVAAPAHRAAFEGRAEHRRDADDLQRGRHEPPDGDAQSVQGSVREEARREARLHGLLHQGGGAGAEGCACGQCRDRWHRPDLQELL